MPTPQLVDLIIDHFATLVVLILGIERVVFALRRYVSDEWYLMSELFLDVLNSIPIPRFAAATLIAMAARSVYHVAAYHFS